MAATGVLLRFSKDTVSNSNEHHWVHASTLPEQLLGHYEDSENRLGVLWCATGDRPTIPIPILGT